MAAPFAFARPDQVIIIRHGEKPEKPEGDDLNQKGRERAGALAAFFQGGEIGTPVAIYAQGVLGKHHSRRPMETVEPLARALKLTVHAIDHDEFAAMAKEILTTPEYNGKIVLISWDHKGIPDVATALGVANPPAWPKQVFDRLWIVHLKDGTATLQNAPQRLLYGDSKD